MCYEFIKFLDGGAHLLFSGRWIPVQRASYLSDVSPKYEHNFIP